MITISEFSNYPQWVKICGIILLILVVTYIYILSTNYPKEQKTPIEQANKVGQEQTSVAWVNSDETLKHKIIYTDKLNFKVEDVPYCIKHDMQLIDYGEEYVCIKNNCKTAIPKQFKTKIHDTAISLAEKKLRDMK